MVPGRDVEQRHVEVVTTVKAVVSVPVAVKLSPYFSSPGEMALRLDRVGADGLVLFNRFIQPDIDPETLTITVGFGLSSPAEGRLPRAWIARLAGRVRASLAASTGVAGPDDLAARDQQRGQPAREAGRPGRRGRLGVPAGRVRDLAARRQPGPGSLVAGSLAAEHQAGRVCTGPAGLIRPAGPGAARPAGAGPRRPAAAAPPRR
jgi:hypothetical protein